ncbi:hypothetical protein D3C71_2228630 [compost metagenome]
MPSFLAEEPKVRTSSFTFAMKAATATSASNFDAPEMVSGMTDSFALNLWKEVQSSPK